MPILELKVPLNSIWNPQQGFLLCCDSLSVPPPMHLLSTVIYYFLHSVTNRCLMWPLPQHVAFGETWIFVPGPWSLIIGSRIECYPFVERSVCVLTMLLLSFLRLRSGCSVLTCSAFWALDRPHPPWAASPNVSCPQIPQNMASQRLLVCFLDLDQQTCWTKVITATELLHPYVPIKDMVYLSVRQGSEQQRGICLGVSWCLGPSALLVSLPIELDPSMTMGKL